MKLFKYSAIAFFVSIASFSSCKSNAYLIQPIDNTEYITYEPIHQPNNQEFLIGNFEINENTLQPGQYRLKNDIDDNFGFLFVNNNLPGNLVQINMDPEGNVSIFFNGNTNRIIVEKISEHIVTPLNIIGNVSEFINLNFDTEIRIRTPLNHIQIPLFPNEQVQPNDIKPLLPNQIIDEQSRQISNIFILNPNVHEIDTRKLLNEGFLYRYQLPEEINDRIAKEGILSVALFQNGVLLTQLNSPHHKVQTEGMGRTSFFTNGYLYFSTLNNINPNETKLAIGYINTDQNNINQQEQIDPKALLVLNEIGSKKLLLNNAGFYPWPINNKDIKGPQGFLYRYDFPEDLIYLLDERPELQVLLYENNHPLTQINCWHGNIEHKGMGRTSFCENGFIYFSTSDNRPLEGNQFSINVMEPARKIIIERQKNPDLKFNKNIMIHEPSLFATKNARNFANAIYNISSNLNICLEKSKIFPILENWRSYNINDTFENLLKLLETDLEKTIKYINEEAIFCFPKTFIELLSQRAINYITEDYNRFIDFCNLHKDKNFLHDREIQKIIGSLKLLTHQHRQHFGKSIKNCYQKFAKDIFISAPKNLINVDFRYFNKIDAELKNALECKGEWSKNESVMNAAIVANTYHVETSNLLDQIIHQFGNNIRMFNNIGDIKTWLNLENYPQNYPFYTAHTANRAIDTSYERLTYYLANQHEINFNKPIPNMYAYDYMLYVISHIRFCCENLAHEGLEQDADTLKFKLIVCLQEQDGNCDKGMVGRLFTILAATLSQYNVLIDKINNDGVKPVIK